MDPGVRGHGMKADPPGQGTYMYGPNMNAFWWATVEIWNFEKLEHKTQCDADANADDWGDTKLSINGVQ